MKIQNRSAPGALFILLILFCSAWVYGSPRTFLSHAPDFTQFYLLDDQTGDVFVRTGAMTAKIRHGKPGDGVRVLPSYPSPNNDFSAVIFVAGDLENVDPRASRDIFVGLKGGATIRFSAHELCSGSDFDNISVIIPEPLRERGLAEQQMLFIKKLGNSSRLCASVLFFKDGPRLVKSDVLIDRGLRQRYLYDTYRYLPMLDVLPAQQAHWQKGFLPGPLIAEPYAMPALGIDDKALGGFGFVILSLTSGYVALARQARPTDSPTRIVEDYFIVQRLSDPSTELSEAERAGRFAEKFQRGELPQVTAVELGSSGRPLVRWIHRGKEFSASVRTRPQAANALADQRCDLFSR